MDLHTQISAALLELKRACLAIQSDLSDANWHELMNTYDLLFLGERFNVIDARELHHALHGKFGIRVDFETFLSLIPGVCRDLGMEAEPQIRLKDMRLPDPPIASYSITLF